MTDKELMQQALDFLVGGDFAYPTKLATDLRDRLAQPEQEPVAHTLNCVCGAVWDVSPDGVEEMVHAPNPPHRKPEQEPTGCSCRWDSEGDRVVTCARHEGWLEVVAEWADRARDAEKKLKALNTSPPQRKPPQFPTMLRKMWSGAEVQKWINENWEQA